MAVEEEEVGGASAKKGSPPSKEAEVVSVEFPAPAGWKKKFMLNEDGTPRRNEIVFVSPTGEEMKNKRQLQQYLKSHPGGPSSSDFDWRSGDTPRRSARIREKAKAVETPENEKPRKRERKSSSKKGAKEKKDDGSGLDETPGVKEDDATTGEAEAPTDVEMKESGADVNVVENEGVAGEVAANSDADGKAGGEQDSVKANGNGQEKTEPSSKNDDEEAAPEMEKNQADDKPAKAKVSPSAGSPEEASAGKEMQDREVLSGNISHKEDSNAVVSKDVPSANCSDGEHPPGASPINS
ncbi:Methyl-CpG binding domain [Musa troglodytarum]|uniref:Methyl-CpG binding domain n=1 Tax=Musa troglodytarum TaxID=320322 RepID=A0A9E7FFS6_9LILI|nr:Methyl-CpG binding domain [Musa troglodytarum]